MTEYEDEWAADKDANEAQAAADAGVAASKKLDADPDFDYDEPGTIDVLSAAKMQAAPALMAEPVKPLTFKETFAARRKAGDSTFEWNGKKYTTDLKKPATANTTSPRVNASPAATKPAPAEIKAFAPSQTLTQKLGGDYAAVKSAADRMPIGTSAAARSALNEDVARRQRAYEQAANAEKSATSVTQKLGSNYVSVKQAADNMPAGTSPAARQALSTMVSASQRTYEEAAAAEKASTTFSSGRNYPGAPDTLRR